jgi:hypothetical protein
VHYGRIAELVIGGEQFYRSTITGENLDVDIDPIHGQHHGQRDAFN